MAVYFFIAAQFLLFFIFTRNVRVRGLGLFSIFYFVFALLIALPFLFIAMHAEQMIDLATILRRAPDAKISLELGDGFKPLLVSMMFQSLYFAGGYLQLKRNPQVFEKRASITNVTVPKYFVWIALFLAVVSLSYILLRYLYSPDFPLFKLLQGETANLKFRDLAYNYGIRVDLPYIFRPSVHSQFYRILLPLSAVIIIHVLITDKDSRTPWMYALLGVLVSVTLLLNFGTLKRTPILYLVLWCFCYMYMYERAMRQLQIVGFLLIALFATLTISALYIDKDLFTVLQSLVRRLLIVEAVGEFVALEHFGQNCEFLGLDIAQRYFQKLLGQDVQTFSEYWKLATGGTRGFTSVGVMTEIFISISYYSVVLYLGIGFCLSAIDVKMYQNRHTIYRPLIAGLITVISFVSVKGLLSQFFTGGIFSLLVLALSLAFLGRLFEKNRKISSTVQN